MEERKNNYSVYYHYNPKNGKYYIGITMQEPQKRWNSGNGYRYNSHFWKAILRDGWDSFEHVVIETGLSREMAVSMEKRLIKECDSYNNGYNNSYGGESMDGYEMCQSTKDKISVANSGENGYWFGKKLPDYMIQKMAEKHINHPLLSRPINQYDSNGHYIKTYPSVKEACRQLGHGNFARAAQSLNALCYGYQWRYDNGDYSDIEPYDSFHPTPKRRKAVLQYDLDGNFIQEYESIEHITDKEGKAHISDCCNKKRNSALGYIWRYKDISNAQCNTEGYYDVKPYQKVVNGEKEVIVYDIQGNFCGKYKSMQEAARKYGTTTALMGAVCRGERKHSKGYIFAYSDITDNELQKKIEFANSKIIKKSIAQYDLEGNLITIHKRARDAASYIGVAGRDKIVACCFGMIPNAFGYIWKYAE